MLKHSDEIQNLALKNPQNTNIFHDGIIEYYHQRPPQFEQMSLYHYASWYEKCPPAANTASTNNRMLPHHQLTTGGWINK